MTTTNPNYVQKAIQGALDDFDQAAGPSNINEPLFKLCCDLLELSHAAPDLLSEAEAEQLASDRARLLGHDPASIASTWKSAEKTTRGKARVIPEPSYTNGAPPAAQGFADLAAYAASRGLPAEVFERAGWSDSRLWEIAYTDRNGKQQRGHTDDEPLRPLRERRALRLESDAGPRWRLIDEDKPSPKYWHRPGAHLDHNKAWYRLGEALALAAQVGYLALVNGEAGVIVAQHWGIPALCETGGGEKLTPPQLLQLLRVVWTKPIVIALDCDAKGQKAAAKKREQYLAAGYTDVRAIDLALGLKDDIADFCRLHQAASPQQLLACSDLPMPAARTAGSPNQQRTQSQAIIDQLTQLGYTFRLNLCADIIEVNGEPITDTLAATMRTQLRDIGWKRFGALEDAYTAHAATEAYHPVRDYLLALPPWDGQPRIAQLAAYLHSTDPDVTYQNGATCTLTSVYCHRWLIGAAAKALDGKQNAMLVLAGPQRLGKSTLAKWFCPLPKLFLEQSINTNDKDSHLRLITSWIWEVSELDATTRKADVAALKHFITQGTVTVRRSYGRFDTQKPALASLIGTVNDGNGFLMDDTGNRRFFVLDLISIDQAYQQLDRAQLWAEALHRYRAGEPWELLSEEFTTQTAQNRQYLADTPIADWLRKYFYLTGDANDRMTAGDIIESLQSRGVRLPASDHALAIQLNRAAAMLGLGRERTNSGRFYLGITPKP